MHRHHDSSSGSLARASRASTGVDASASLSSSLAADPLSDVLRSVQLSGALYFIWTVSSPYATAVPDARAFAPVILPRSQQIISYHIVTQGSCWGGLLGEQPVQLHAGDILLIPHGDAYVISSSARKHTEARTDLDRELAFFRSMAAGELPFVIVEGRGPHSTQLVCGFLGCDVRPFNPVLAALPRLVHVRRSERPSLDRMQPLLDYTLAEARASRPGGQSVLVRLGELMFVEVVRRYLLEAPDSQSGWLAGLRDPVVGRALTLLHRTPAASWTLDALAAQAGVSRSRLAESFARFVGQPPMQYLARWRLQLAARMLASGSAKVSAIARDVGYDSEAAFSRAFKRHVGVSPSRWRAHGTTESR